jgi:hypothetical protein
MKITKKQLELLHKNIDEMALSDEQFIFMLYKNQKGTDNITGHAHNVMQEKLIYYLQKESQRAITITGDTNEQKF